MKDRKFYLVSNQKPKRTRRSSRSSVLQIVSEEYAALDVPPISAAQLSALWLMLNTSTAPSDKEGGLRESA